MRMVLMGPPGAGKGTQAKRLADRYGMAHLSSGDILRAERGSGSELGNRLKGFMDAGKLVPDAVVVEIMAGAIAGLPAEKGLLLDGFPRTVPQAQAWTSSLAACAGRWRSCWSSMCRTGCSWSGLPGGEVARPVAGCTT